MRNVFMVAAFAASLVVTEQASAQSFQFGPMAGVSIANVSGDGVDTDTDSRTGLFAGAQVVWQSPGALFGLETGAIYVQKGFSSTVEGEGEGSFELDYIEVPLLLRVAPPLGDASLTPAFGLGATLGFKVGCSVSGESEGVEVDIDCDEFDFPTNSTDVGLTATAGVDVPMGGVTIAPFARYTHGLMNIIDTEDDDTDAKNTVIMVGAAVRFGGR